MRRQRGQLERDLLNCLWSTPEGSTARGLLDAVDGDKPALTTVLTVLERLRAKGLVTRTDRGPDGHVYLPAQSQSDHVVDSMISSLTSTQDRHAALVQFAGHLDQNDADILRRLLQDRGSQNPGR